jgi:polyhydroxybutyrate depolymerase
MGPPDMMPPTEAEILAERPYQVTVPPSYSDTQKWPLLIVLAGFGGVGTDTSAYLGFTQLAADQGIFLVAPDADPLHARFSWNPDPEQYPTFDVLYLTAIIHDLEAKYAIDHGRVFVAGHSQGGEMAHRMACDASADVAAIVSHAGQVTKDPAGCAPTQAVSAVEIHGTADQTIGYYGDVQNNPPDPSIPSAHETIAVWARNDACTGALTATGATLDLVSDLAGNETTVEAYGGCPAGIGVELWTIQNGVHHPQVTAAFAPTAWQFLTAHARP